MDRVFAFQESSSIKACIFISQSDFVLYATNTHIVLFSPAKASIVESAQFPKNQSPVQAVSLTQISQTQFLLQSRNGWILIYHLNEGKLQFEFAYRIGYVGFAKVAFFSDSNGFPNLYYYFDQQKVELFRQDALNKQSHSIVMDQDDKVSHITHMHAQSVTDAKQRVYICTEGGRILLYQIVFKEKKEPICLLMEIYSIESKTEPVIILDSALLIVQNSAKLLCTVRQSNIVLCDIESKQNKFVLNQDKKAHNSYRLLCQTEDHIYAISNSRIARLHKDKLCLETIIQFGKQSLVNDFKIIEGQLALVATEDQQLLVIELHQ